MHQETALETYLITMVLDWGDRDERIMRMICNSEIK